MTDSSPPRKIKPHVALLRATGAELIARGQAMLAQADALVGDDDAEADPWLGIPELHEQYKITRETLAAAKQRGELSPRRGPKGRVMIRRSEIERWLESRPWTPRKGQAPTDLDEWELAARKALK